MATTSTSALFTRSWWLSNARATPSAYPGGLGGHSRRLGGQRRDLEVVRERLQGRDVRLRRPAAIRISTDDADANSLVIDALLNMYGRSSSRRSSRENEEFPVHFGPLAPVPQPWPCPPSGSARTRHPPCTVSSSTVKWIAIGLFAKTASYAPRTAGLPDAVGKARRHEHAVSRRAVRFGAASPAFRDVS